MNYDEIYGKYYVNVPCIKNSLPAEEIVTCPLLTANEVRVLIYLIKLTSHQKHKKVWCFIGKKTLAEKVCMHKKTVYLTIESLIEKGFIKEVGFGKRVYYLTVWHPVYGEQTDNSNYKLKIYPIEENMMQTVIDVGIARFEDSTNNKKKPKLEEKEEKKESWSVEVKDKLKSNGYKEDEVIYVDDEDELDEMAREANEEADMYREIPEKPKQEAKVLTLEEHRETAAYKKEMAMRAEKERKRLEKEKGVSLSH